jgi:hypothetical protein
MPKSPCPQGQTRNRVTKSCRYKEKPGRKHGTRKAPKPKAKTVKFQVHLINNELDFAAGKESDTTRNMFTHFQTEYNNDSAPGSVLVAKHAAKIVKWYKQFKDDYEETLGIKSIKHKHGNVFEIKYTGDDEVSLDSYLDIDEDGNYPIKIKDVNYLISGERVGSK